VTLAAAPLLRAVRLRRVPIPAAALPVLLAATVAVAPTLAARSAATIAAS